MGNKSSASRRGPKPKPPDEKCEAITVYIKRARIIALANGGSIEHGRDIARKLAKKAIEE